MFFLIVCIIVWSLYTVVMKRRFRQEFRLSNALLVLILFSLIVSISLGVNYVAAAIPSINDGIGIHNFLAYWIIGDDRWTLSLFKSYFNYSLATNIILLLLYSGLKIMRD